MPAFSSSGPDSSSWMSPKPVRNRHSPRRPLERRAPAPAVPCTCEPAGNSMRTSIDSRPPQGAHCRHSLGALMSNVPLAYSTRVCSAKATSNFFKGSPGRTSTTVSARSLATMRTSPTLSSRLTEMGRGVSKGRAIRFVSAPSRCSAACHKSVGGSRRRAGSVRSSRAAAARTSQELTESPSPAAACSTRDFKRSGSRKLIRETAASSPSTTPSPPRLHASRSPGRRCPRRFPARAARPVGGSPQTRARARAGAVRPSPARAPA